MLARTVGDAMTTQTEARQRVLAAMRTRHLEVEDVARLAGYHPRTIERFVKGRTFNPKTLDKLEHVLGLARKARNDRYRPVPAKSGHEPIVGWEQAAQVLRISVRTLRRHRREHGDTSRPWWDDVTVVKAWYATLIARSSG